MGKNPVDAKNKRTLTPLFDTAISKQLKRILRHCTMDVLSKGTGNLYIVCNAKYNEELTRWMESNFSQLEKNWKTMNLVKMI